MLLSHSAAQALMVAAQGLDQRPTHPATKDDVLQTIRRMGALQIDTIHVVARSPYFVLFSRLGEYQQSWLDDLLAEGRIFEYWSHAASFLPSEDYPLYRRMMLDREYPVFIRAPEWIKAHEETVAKLLNYIRENGPVQASNFERTDGQQGGWWNWKPEKIALEALLTTGDLMIVRRHNFQRIYDLRGRVLPNWDDSQAPPFDQVKRELTLKSVCALGVTPVEWIPDYFRMSNAGKFYKPGKGKVNLAEQLADQGLLVRVEVENWKSPGFVHPDNLALAEKAASGELVPTLTTLLSPFDPITWHRERASAMWNFDYKIECYTPEAKRRYGYFSLPILRRGLLIGRLDAKAHRQQGLFEVKALHLEPGIVVDAALIDDLSQALIECANWHKTPEIAVRRSDPPELAAMLEGATKQLV